MAKEYTKQHIVPACHIANFGTNGNEGRKSSIYCHIKEKRYFWMQLCRRFPS